MLLDYSKINPDSVTWAYQNSIRLLDGETDRIRALNDKAAQLAGFAGVILAILGAAASPGFEASLGAVGEALFAIFYFAAAALLAATILVLVMLVFKPRRYIAIDSAEIQNYLEDDRLLRSARWALEIRTMRTVRRAAKWAEVGGEQMASRIGWAAWLFASGLVCFLGATVTLGAGQL